MARAKQHALGFVLMAVLMTGAALAVMEQFLPSEAAALQRGGERSKAKATTALVRRYPGTPAAGTDGPNGHQRAKPGGMRARLESEWRDMAALSSSSSCTEQPWTSTTVADSDFVDADCSVLSEDFEADAGGFTAGHVQRQLTWQRVTNRAATPGHSPSTSFYWGDPATFSYGTGFAEGATLTSPVVNTTSLSSPGLVFNHFLDAEGFSYDTASVEVSTDGGATFTPIASSQSFGPLGGLPDGFTFGRFRPAVVDLSGYTGPNTVIRFGFVCDATVGYEGWYVDDVCIGNVTSTDTNGGGDTDLVRLGDNLVGAFQTVDDIDQYRFHGVAGQAVHIRSYRGPRFYASLRTEASPDPFVAGYSISTKLPSTGNYVLTLRFIDQPDLVGNPYKWSLRGCDMPVFTGAFDDGSVCSWTSSVPPKTCARASG
ncbi:MAG: hypothetical protein U0610_03585 [bacterium]